MPQGIRPRPPSLPTNGPRKPSTATDDFAPWLAVLANVRGTRTRCSRRDSTRTSGVIIEFIGPPGAGKSTVAHAVGRQLAVPVVNLDGNRTFRGRLLTPQQVISQRRLAVLKQPTLSVAMLAGLLAGDRGASASWRVNLIRRNDLMRRLAQNSSTAIIEEGPVHAAVLVMAESRRSPEASRIVRYLTLPDVVVSLHAATPTTTGRVLKRGKVLSDWPPDALDCLARRYSFAAPAIEASVPTNVIVLDSTAATPDELAASISAAIRQIHRSN
jgi:hypothetical protein